jgi:hypothetical protein
MRGITDGAAKWQAELLHRSAHRSLLFTFVIIKEIFMDFTIYLLLFLVYHTIFSWRNYCYSTDLKLLESSTYTGLDMQPTSAFEVQIFLNGKPDSTHKSVKSPLHSSKS